MEMISKNLLVPFLVIASVLLLVSTVSAAEIADVYRITVDGADVEGTVFNSGDTVSVVAGDTATIKVYFTALENDQDVSVKAEIEGDKVDVEANSASFDVEKGKRYSKVLTLKMPFELEDQLSDDITLNIEVNGNDHKTELDEITLRIQRASYDADIKSVNAPKSVFAGESFPVDVVLKNIGYNDLEDVFVSVSIKELGVESSDYLGDIVAIECSDSDEDEDPTDLYGVDISRKCNENDVDTVRGRLSLKIPFEVEPGVYSLEVSVKNDDTTSSMTKQIAVENDFVSNVVVTNTRKTVAVGEEAEYSLLIVNPTDKVKVFRVVTESSGDLSSSASEAVVAVPAGSSKTVAVTAKAETEGEYNFNVNVFSGEKLVDVVTFTAKVEGSKVGANNPVVVLTVILAIVFLVLLVVLIVLLGRKPEKAEEFGESYY